MTSLMDEARVAAGVLASLPGVTPARLRMLLDGLDPEEAVVCVNGGRHPADPQGRWKGLCGQDQMAVLRERCTDTAVDIYVLGMDGYPSVLSNDPKAPAVIFTRSRPDLLDTISMVSMVCVVGTRAASPYGMKVAYEIGRDLASAGISVVSGLARGIDTAVHRGVLEDSSMTARAAAPVSPAALPVAVVAGGPDVPYPTENCDLFSAVAGNGVIISEVPPGASAQKWRFVARNRIMAALSAVVVVVESHSSGGSLHTAEYALRQGKQVAAIPGPIYAPASRGSNELLRDEKAKLVSGAADIIFMLEKDLGAVGPLGMLEPEGMAAGVVSAAGAGNAAGVRNASARRTPGLAPFTCQDGPSTFRVLDHSRDLGVDQVLQSAVLGLLSLQPLTLEEIVILSGQPVGKISLCLESLADEGLAREWAGSWTRC
ncbi:MAG: DNA-processing protein DprA [Acidimicrobiales bacterium]